MTSNFVTQLNDDTHTQAELKNGKGLEEGSELVLPEPRKRYVPSFKSCLAQDQTNFLSPLTTVLSSLYCNNAFFALLKQLQAAKHNL